MAMTMTLKHLQKTPSGKWQYRRRWPTALSAVVSKAPFKMTLQAQSEVELLREYPKVEAEYHRQVKAMLYPVRWDDDDNGGGAEATPV